jgi:hypothetical protein
MIVVISKQYDVAILADRQDRRTPKENPRLDDGSASNRSGRPLRVPQGQAETRGCHNHSP